MSMLVTAKMSSTYQCLIIGESINETCFQENSWICLLELNAEPLHSGANDCTVLTKVLLWECTSSLKKILKY